MSSIDYILLAPPTPPFRLHYGNLYTWILLDVCARNLEHSGVCVLLPECWSLGGFRFDKAISEERRPDEASDKTVVRVIRDGINRGRTDLRLFSIAPSADITLRDDDPSIVSALRAIVRELIDDGLVRRERKPCLTCRSCGQSIFSAHQRSEGKCVRCGGLLHQGMREDWFLSVPWGTIHRRAQRIQWIPGSSLHRFSDLEQLGSSYPVANARSMGIPFDPEPGWHLDQRFVGSLYPSILRRSGKGGKLVCVGGLDILRKWILLLISANPDDAQPDVVVNHGMLLNSLNCKISKYHDAQLLAQSTASQTPDEIRVDLLRQPLGKDFVFRETPSPGAYRLVRKYANILRFFMQFAPESDTAHSEFLSSLDSIVADIRSHLEPHGLRPKAALEVFRHLCFTVISGKAIPMVGDVGISSTAKRRLLATLMSVGQIFAPRTTECARVLMAGGHDSDAGSGAGVPGRPAIKEP